MSRPTTHDDLPDYVRAGHQVAVITADYVVRHPSLGQHLLAALAEAERLGMTVENGTISIPKTIEELDKSLDQAQRSWDSAADWYAAAIDGTPVEDWKRGTINRWAADEARDAVDWDAIDADVQVSA